MQLTPCNAVPWLRRLSHGNLSARIRVLCNAERKSHQMRQEYVSIIIISMAPTRPSLPIASHGAVPRPLTLHGSSPAAPYLPALIHRQAMHAETSLVGTLMLMVANGFVSLPSFLGSRTGGMRVRVNGVWKPNEGFHDWGWI